MRGRSLIFGALVVGACGGRIGESSSAGGVPFPSDESDASTPATDAAVDSGPVTSTIVYVSAASGNDANDGLTPTTAKRTLTAGVVTAKSNRAEVHACAGDYSEKDFALADTVSLLGGYDCKTWTRTSSYGGPTFDGVNESRVERDASSTLDNTVLVQGASVVRAAVIDGFTILGPSPSTAGAALNVTGGASPTITNNKIIGGAGGKYSTIAVRVDQASSPDIGFDSLDGGQGGTPSDLGPDPSSVGLWSFSASPHVHDSVLNAGTGVCTDSCSSSIAALMTGDPNADPRPPVRFTVADGTAFERNVIRTGPQGQNADGLELSWVDAADLIGNDFYGASVGLPAVDISIPVTLYVAKSILFTGNRVHGGLGANGYGLRAVNVTNLIVTNNMLHGGDAGGGTALWLVDTDEAFIAFNTLYSGSQSQAPIGAGHSALEVSGSVIAGGNKGSVIVDNLFVGTGDGGSGISFEAGFPDTFGQTVTEFSNNAFARQGGPLLAAYGGAHDDTIAELENDINGTVVDGGTPPHASGNVLTPSDLSSLFVSFSDPPDDATSDLFGTGWKLKVKSSCAVAHGGTMNVPGSGQPVGVSTDFYGTNRSTSVPSIGASELVGVCDVP